MRYCLKGSKAYAAVGGIAAAGEVAGRCSYTRGRLAWPVPASAFPRALPQTALLSLGIRGGDPRREADLHPRARTWLKQYVCLLCCLPNDLLFAVKVSIISAQHVCHFVRMH
jgi:hypothetical protein